KRATETSVTLGREARFAVLVANNGPNPATGVSITDIPAGAPHVIAQAPWTCSADGVLPVQCSLPQLAAGQSAPPVEVTYTPDAPGQSCNTVMLRADQVDPAADNNPPRTVCVTVVAPFALNEFVALGNERL